MIDFMNDENLEKFFGKLHDDSHSHIVVHKHGLLCSMKFFSCILFI